ATWLAWPRHTHEPASVPFSPNCPPWPSPSHLPPGPNPGSSTAVDSRCPSHVTLTRPVTLVPYSAFRLFFEHVQGSIGEGNRSAQWSEGRRHRRRVRRPRRWGGLR